MRLRLLDCKRNYSRHKLKERPAGRSFSFGFLPSAKRTADKDTVGPI